MTQTMIPIYTIGYGARSIEQLLSVLDEHQIEYLIDIRTAPYSRYKPEFSKAALEVALQRGGVRYLFLGDQLGGRPDDPECYVDGKVDYAVIKQKPFFLQGIERVENAFAQQRRVMLMCSEGKPEECHRSKLLGAFLEEQNIPVLHIDEQNMPLTQGEVVFRLTNGQLHLFGEPSFTSRKRYQSDGESSA